MTNPIHIVKKYKFILDEPINKKALHHLGTCICGTRGSCSYDSFKKGKFCRNKNCKFYQKAKRLDHKEMKIIAQEKNCVVFSLTGRGKETILEYCCICNFQQKCKWKHFYRDKWCKNFKCKKYHKQKNLTTELIRKWFEFENYSTENDFNYNSLYGNCTGKKFTLKCPKNHITKVSISMWMNGSRCKTCNGDGRTLSYDNIKKVYEKHGCTLIYSEKDFTGNVTENEVPYICPKGHTIKNLTKNNFNTRINLDIGPCPICRTIGRDRKKENKKTQDTLFKKYGVRNCSRVPRFHKKQQQSSFSAKLYMLPSGKVIELQGYEPRCIDFLLDNQKYHENDILTDLEDMPTIWYFNPYKKKRARYFPDIFIPSEKIVIEVKSTYTLTLEYERNIAKFNATTKSGYELHLYVFDEKQLCYVKKFHTSGTITLEPAPLAKLIFID